MNAQNKIGKQIEAAVAEVRRAYAVEKANAEKPLEVRHRYAMLVWRALGAVDALTELDPKNPAWTKTGWVS
jgi:hypothetical protein